MSIQLQTSKKAASLWGVGTITGTPVQHHPETRSAASKVTSESNHLPDSNIHKVRIKRNRLYLIGLSCTGVAVLFAPHWKKSVSMSHVYLFEQV